MDACISIKFTVMFLLTVLQVITRHPSQVEECVDLDLEAGPHLLAVGDDLIRRQDEAVPGND